MKKLPKYTKVRTLGSSRTEKALVGEVVLQEKVDGSQFRFGLNEENKVLCGSKSVEWVEGQKQKMFQGGINYINSITDAIKVFPTDTYFFGEYLNKPKHNVLTYGRVPKNGIVIFDMMINGEWVEDRNKLVVSADSLGLEVVPELWRGTIDVKKLGEINTGLEFLKTLIKDNESFLGDTIIEGIVIKNYHEFLDLGGVIFPLFTKYVREEYKEQHTKDWKSRSPKATLQDYFDSFCNENRWKKAIQHLKEKDELTQSPKDIGTLIKEVQIDIIKEEGENIKDKLYKQFIGDIKRRAVRGLPEWYKELLVKENIQESK